MKQQIKKTIKTIKHTAKTMQRTPVHWRSLDQKMPKVEKAFNCVRDELAEVGLLADGVYLDKIELYVSAIPSLAREAGYVFDSVKWHSSAIRVLGFKPGMIYLPCDLPHQVYVPGGTLIDVIRHEFAHSWFWLDPDFIRQPWFKAAFGLDYEETGTTPGELWEQNAEHNQTYQRGLKKLRTDRERKNYKEKHMLAGFVSDYAWSKSCEDFAETFMTYLRCRNNLDRFKSRKGVYKKLKAVQSAVSVAAKNI